MRCLEIGPNKRRIEGFETLDIQPGPLVDHVADCRTLPFPNGSFDLVYASHVIEHVAWFETAAMLGEWARVLAPGGALEVHTIDAAKLMRALLEYDETGNWTGPSGTGFAPENWRTNLTGGDPYLWAVGRIMNWPKDRNPYQWHKSLFTPARLRRCFEDVGLVDLEPLDSGDIRGTPPHDWVDHGYRGRKPDE